MPKNFPSTEENNSSPQKPRGVGYGYEGVWFWGSVLGMQGDGSGIMEVAMLGFDLAWV